MEGADTKKFQPMNCEVQTFALQPVFLAGTILYQAETRYFHLPNEVPVHENLLCSYMNFK